MTSVASARLSSGRPRTGLRRVSACSPHVFSPRGDSASALRESSCSDWMAIFLGVKLTPMSSWPPACLLMAWLGLGLEGGRVTHFTRVGGPSAPATSPHAAPQMTVGFSRPLDGALWGHRASVVLPLSHAHKPQHHVRQPFSRSAAPPQPPTLSLPGFFFFLIEQREFPL